MRDQNHGIFIFFTDLSFDMMYHMHILNKRQQFKDIQKWYFGTVYKKHWHIHVFVWMVKKGLKVLGLLPKQQNSFIWAL